jgi:hypothetical protein
VKWRGKYSKKNAEDEPAEKQGPYGWVIVLRALQKAAIRLRDRPASFVVLGVVAGYMDQDGHCRVSQDTIAAQLGMTRQAVNRHLKVLEEREILFSEASRDGVLKTYTIDQTEVADVRFGQERIDERRKAKRAAKAGKIPSAVAAKPKPAVKDDGGKQVDPELKEVIAELNPEPELEVGKPVHHDEMGRGIVYRINANRIDVKCENAGPLYATNRSFLKVLNEPAQPLSVSPPLEACHSGEHWIGKTVYDNSSGGATGVIVKLDGEPGKARYVFVHYPGQPGSTGKAVGHLQMVA